MCQLSISRGSGAPKGLALQAADRERMSQKIRMATERFNLLRRLQNMTRRLPGLSCRRYEQTILVESVWKDGFNIAVLFEGGRRVLLLGSWYDEVESSEVAYQLIEKAVTGRLRVRIESRNNRDRSWSVDVITPEGEWVEIANKSTLEFWSRGPTSIRCLQFKSVSEGRLAGN